MPQWLDDITALRDRFADWEFQYREHGISWIAKRTPVVFFTGGVTQVEANSADLLHELLAEVEQLDRQHTR